MAHDVTALLNRWKGGDRAALEELMPLIYDELRRVAGRHLAHERSGHTLQPTALVHEAFLRLAGHSHEWQNRAHFIGAAAEMMRRILVDYARARNAEKRGSGVTIVGLDASIPEEQFKNVVEVLEVDRALTRLAEMDPRQGKIVELRFFGGLTIDETAEFIGLSPASVKREWTLAKAWLRREMARGPSPSPSG